MFFLYVRILFHCAKCDVHGSVHLKAGGFPDFHWPHCGVGWDWGCSISCLPGVGGRRGLGRHRGPQQHVVHLRQPGRALCSCLDEISESFNFPQKSTCELCVIHTIVMFPSAILTPDHRSVVEDHRGCDDAHSKVVDDACDELSESWKICRYGM